MDIREIINPAGALTAGQQGAAPDRLQPCVSLASSLHFGLPAAGELGRCVAAPARMREAGSTLAADMLRREVEVVGVGVAAGRGLLALVRVLGCGG